MSSSLKDQLLQKGLVTPEQAESIEKKSASKSSETRTSSSSSRQVGASSSRESAAKTSHRKKEPEHRLHSASSSVSHTGTSQKQPHESSQASRAENHTPGHRDSEIHWPSFWQDFRVSIPVKGERRWYVEGQDGRIAYLAVSEMCAEWLERGQAAIVELQQGGFRIVNREGAHKLQHTEPAMIRCWNHTILSEVTPYNEEPVMD